MRELAILLRTFFGPKHRLDSLPELRLENGKSTVFFAMLVVVFQVRLAARTWRYSV